MRLEKLVLYVTEHEKHFFTFCGKMFRTPALKKAISQISFDQFDRKIVFSEDLIMLSTYLTLRPSVTATTFGNSPAGYVAVENADSTTMAGKRDSRNSYESYMD